MQAYTTVQRGGVAYDVEIKFVVTHYVPGARQTYWQPADPAEYAFAITEIGLLNPDEPPLTGDELATLTRWFETEGNDAAYAVAEGSYVSDQEMTRGCDAYHRQRDEGVI